MKSLVVKPSDIEAFERDGAVLIEGLFSGFIDQITTGIEKTSLTPESTPPIISLIVK